VLRRALATTHFAAIEARAAELEQFAGRVAHDIRNPLAAARVAAELAEKRTSDEFVRELHRRIMRSLGRADAITTDLLGFARSGAKPDPGARAAPRSIVHEVTTDLAHDAERMGIELCADPVPPVAVACSRGVYLSLLGNLVRNAIKYMRDAPTRRITVRVVEDDGFVRTEVVDTGPGIAEDLLPSLFQPYFRGPSGGAEGLGLGLATVKRLAEGHGGRAGVRSERGKGSTFWFELPRAGVDEVEEVRGSAPSHPAFQPRNSA
ncbi:MAG: sensor histidine kinase, partial [Polyangiales bacterium]